MDGARVFNAAVSMNVEVKEILQHVDSVSVCLSKVCKTMKAIPPSHEHPKLHFSCIPTPCIFVFKVLSKWIFQFCLFPSCQMSWKKCNFGFSTPTPPSLQKNSRKSQINIFPICLVIIMAPKGHCVINVGHCVINVGHCVINVSVRHGNELLMCTTLWSHLLQNGSADVSLPDTYQIREECRCATFSSFLPWALHNFN